MRPAPEAWLPVSPSNRLASKALGAEILISRP